MKWIFPLGLIITQYTSPVLMKEILFIKQNVWQFQFRQIGSFTCINCIFNVHCGKKSWMDRENTSSQGCIIKCFWNWTGKYTCTTHKMLEHCNLMNMYIVACQRGGVSNEPPGQRQHTGPGIAYLIRLTFTKTEWAWHVTIYIPNQWFTSQSEVLEKVINVHTAVYNLEPPSLQLATLSWLLHDLVDIYSRTLSICEYWVQTPVDNKAPKSCSHVCVWSTQY